MRKRKLTPKGLFGQLQKRSFSAHPLIMLRKMNHTFPERSASLRMKYGYQ